MALFNNTIYVDLKNVNAPHQQGGELLGKKENRGGSETRESGAASWDTVDDLFDKIVGGNSGNSTSSENAMVGT